MTRQGRKADELRPVSLYRRFTKYAPGSVLVCFGETKVLCTATAEDYVPPFLRDTGTGWINAEYSMLPTATHTRSKREVKSGKPTGRTMEIQRLISRALRVVVDLERLGEISISIDADVLQADGGTRTAAISGSMVALADLIHDLQNRGRIKGNPIREYLAAVSVGIRDGEPLLDLCYEEDSSAEVDMNVVMTESGNFVEIQGTAEKRPYSETEFMSMLGLARKGIHEIIAVSKKAPERPLK